MSDLQNVRDFEYRPSRMRADIGVDFLAEDDVLHGICKDVNNTGIRAQFDCCVAAGRSGLLILRHPTGVLKLEARVAYVENGQVVLVFDFKTPSEYEMAVQFIASTTDRVAVSRSK
jgi:hypothetical protein